MSEFWEKDEGSEVQTSLASYIEPYAKAGIAGASELYQSGGPQFYPDATYTPFANQTERGLQMLENRGTPSQTTNLGTLVDNTLTGDYLDPTTNPYLTQTYNQAAGELTDTFTNTVLPALSAQFGNAGGSNSQIQGQIATNAAGKLSDSLARLQTNLYGGNYQTERSRQMQAGTMVPMFNQVAQQPILDQLQVGGAVEGKAREVLEDEINRFNYYQTRPEINLQNYLRNISGSFPTNQTIPTSGLASTLGGAATLGSLFNSFQGEGNDDPTAGYVGTGLGALIGLLGG